MNKFHLLVEDNIHPILVFNNNQSVIYFNKSAELLSGIHLSKKIFLLAISYATKTFGSHFEYVDLLLADELFYGVMVSYEDDNEICIQLYKKNISLFSPNDHYEGYNKTNINSLLQSNIEYFRLKYNASIKLFTDFDIPDFYIHQNSFCLIAQEILSYLYTQKNVYIDMHIKIGKIIFINDKRHLIISLVFRYDNAININTNNIEKIAKKNHILLINDAKYIGLEIPSIDIF